MWCSSRNARVEGLRAGGLGAWGTDTCMWWLPVHPLSPKPRTVALLKHAVHALSMCGGCVLSRNLHVNSTLAWQPRDMLAQEQVSVFPRVRHTLLLLLCHGRPGLNTMRTASDDHSLRPEQEPPGLPILSQLQSRCYMLAGQESCSTDGCMAGLCPSQGGTGCVIKVLVRAVVAESFLTCITGKREKHNGI